jgi:hypothetical protein
MSVVSFGNPRIHSGNKHVEGFFSTLDSKEFLLYFTDEEKAKVKNIVKAAREIVERVAQLPESKSENRTGAVLVIAKRRTSWAKNNINWTPIAVEINETPLEDKEFGTKETKHTVFALGKVMFLVQHLQEQTSGSNAFYTEYPNPNNAQGKWHIGESGVPAGAVSFDDGWVIGLSGFSPANIDEAAVLGIAVKAGVVSEDKAKHIAIMTGNKEFHRKEDTYLPA